MTNELIEVEPRPEGYEHLREVRPGEWFALRGFPPYVGLCVGVTLVSHRKKYCYASFDEALRVLRTWNGIGEPPGTWIRGV